MHEAVFSLFVSLFWYRFRLCVSAFFCGRAGDDTDDQNDACVFVVDRIISARLLNNGQFAV